MAESASRRPVWVTIVAAVATVVVITGIAAAPMALNCAGSDAGFSACMRAQLADMGLMARDPAPVSAPAETAEQEAAGSQTAASVSPDTGQADADSAQQAAETPTDGETAAAQEQDAPEAGIETPQSAASGESADAAASGETGATASTDADGQNGAAEPAEPAKPAEEERMQVADVSDDPAAADAAESAETVAPAPEDPAQPTLGLVRAEPDGSLVIAGAAEPGATVEIYANDVLLGTTTAGSSGDWAFVPDTPLDPGGVAITVRVPEHGQIAEESVVVVIQDDRTSEPLVVASTPGEASQVMQGLLASDQAAEAPEAASGERTEVADAGAAEETAPAEGTAPAEQQADAPAPSAPAQTADTDTAEAPETARTADVDAAINGAASASDGGDLVAGAPEIAVQEDERASSAEEPMTVAEAPERAETAGAEAGAGPDADVAETPEPAAPATDEAEDQQPLTPPSIDAIEVDGQRNFFAGGGPEGATVRLYVDGEYVADTTVQDGRWLIETTRNYLDERSQRVRVDLLRPGTADVAARAEVNFEIELPEPATETAQEPMAVAEADTAGEAADGAVDGPEQASADGADAPSAQTPESDGEPATSDGDPAQDAEPAAPASDTLAQAPAPEEAGDDTPVEAEMTADAGDTAMAGADEVAGAGAETSSETETARAPDTAEGSNDTAASAPGQVASSGQDIPTMTAVQVGDPGDERFASGQAIIRRGDNLWTIARRVYGQGIRYTTIYQANRDQIRDPDLIYPGQVFDLPGSEEAAADTSGG